ncbi:hypothetical protein HC024_04195 [Methylococcaceae bacterium WWC4]|nr:hypothetical protein [Methylococcaceae bacterium WWC4]
MRFKIKSVLIVAVFALVMAGTNNAAASVTFSSLANLSFSIANIETSASDLSDLEFSASFVRLGADFPATFIDLTGDGVVFDTTEEFATGVKPVQVGTSFSHEFDLAGGVSAGAIDYSQVGWYDVGFNNLGVNSYSITMSYSYSLSTEIVGNDGVTSVGIHYTDSDGLIDQFDEALASSLITGLSSGTKQFSGSFTFTLDGVSNAKTFYIDLNHSGNLLSAAPVPLPAAAWSFLIGLLGVLGFNKKSMVF